MIAQLAAVLAIAGAVAVFFNRIRQPVVLGYVCAGLVARLGFSKYVPGASSPELSTLAELGVIFLLFSLGLEFSFRRVARLGGRVAFAALFEVGAVMAGGAALASLLIPSAPPTSAWIVGAMTAISSTTIIFKALEESGLKTRRFAQYVLGILVFEDLIAVLLMVAITAEKGHSIGHALTTLILFVGGWFLFGTFVLPPLLKRIGRTRSDGSSEEMLVVVSVGLCLGLAVLAASIGFSAGLGAFLMGSILAESVESHRIERLIRPLRDLFVAVFFVSIGMLIEPALIKQYKTVILLLASFVVAAKLLFGTLGAILAGQTLKSSILIGSSLTQIGEFSFVIAAAAVAAGQLDPSFMPIIVSVSVITTLATPYSIRLAPKLAMIVERRMPVRFALLVDRYSSWTELRAAREDPQPAGRTALLRWALSGFIITVAGRLASQIASPAMAPAVGIAVAILMLPFLWGFLRGTEHGDRIRRTTTQIIALLVCALLAWPFFKGTPVTWLVALASVVLIARIVGELELVYHWFEETFLSTLSEGDLKKQGHQSLLRKFAPWEGQLIRLKVHPDSEFSGRTIQDSALRNQFGLNIVAIQRGSKLIMAPQPAQQIFPKDELLVLGEEESVERARRRIELAGSEDAPGSSTEDYELRSIDIPKDSPYEQKTIRESGIRDRHQALVVGIERAGRRLINPDSDLKIQAGDTLWVVGDSARLAELTAAAQPAAAPGTPRA